MKVLLEQKVTLPVGNASVGFIFACPPPIGTGGVVALMEVLDTKGKRIAARLVYRCDVVKANTLQRFSILVHSPKNRRATLRLSGVRTLSARRVNVRKSPTPAGLICPIYGNKQLGQWWELRAPSSVMGAYIDPKFMRFTDSSHVPIYRKIEEALWCVGRTCGLGFRHDPEGLAGIAFHQAPAEQVESLCIQFGNSLQWFGTQAYGSVYLAIHPNKRDVWIGNRQKDAQDGDKLSGINVVRFVLNSIMQTKFGLPYHDDYAGICAATNANFSGPIQFSRRDVECLAGTDSYERGFLQRAYGRPWIMRWDD